VTLKQQKFSQSDPVLIIQIKKIAVRSSPDLAKIGFSPDLCSSLDWSWSPWNLKVLHYSICLEKLSLQQGCSFIKQTNKIKLDKMDQAKINTEW